MAKSGSQERTDLVAWWSVPLLDGVHTVEFEHGTTTGKRVLRVDGQEIVRRDWMFKLVGDEKFTLGKQEAKCQLCVDPMPHFAFSYSLLVDGKPLEKFTEKHTQTTKSWVARSPTKRFRIVLDKATLDIWVNGELVESESCFVENGTEMKFNYEDLEGTIKATSVNKSEGVIYNLFVDGNCVESDEFS